MGFTSNVANIAQNAASDTTISVVLTGVNVGDFIFVEVSGTTIPTITVSDATSSFVPLGQLVFGSSDGVVQGFYLLASVASGSVTYTATYSFGATQRVIIAWAFTPTGAVTFDAGTGQEVTSTVSGDSGNAATSGSDDLALGYSRSYDGGTASAQAINAISCTDVGTYNGVTIWQKTFAAPFTGSATFTNTGSTRLITGIAVFKITAGGATQILHPASWM